MGTVYPDCVYEDAPGGRPDKALCSDSAIVMYVTQEVPSVSDFERACLMPECHRFVAATKRLNPEECAVMAVYSRTTQYLFYQHLVKNFDAICSKNSSNGSSDGESGPSGGGELGTDSSTSSGSLSAETTNSPTTQLPTTQPPSPVENAAATTSSSSISVAAIVIVSVGAVAILLAAWWFGRRWRRRRQAAAHKQHPARVPEGPLTTTNTDNSYYFVQGSGTDSREMTMLPLPDQSAPNKSSVLDQRILQDHRVAADGILTLEFLGKGGHGIVFLVQLQQSTLLASKRLNPSHTTRQQLQRLVDEVKVSSTLKHASIVEFIGVAWTCESDLQVLYEYMPGGDLRSYLQSTAHANGSHPTESGEETLSQWSPLKLQMALQIIEGLAYTHSFDPPLVHRDLKSHNILLCESLRAKISDFGVARFQSEAGTMTTGIGTSRWMAPEVINGGGDYSESSDIYSFGVILTELDTHAVPYDRSSDDGATMGSELSLMQRVGRGELRPAMSLSCPSAIAELAQECLEFEAFTRPNALQIAYRLRLLAKEL